ncbi:MAG: hypothetical protein KA020_18215 [Planctomycetes bacterium]|jgi:hypothetical protein|nr:hypothetical protein [Planctomycetota bacterium]
MLATLSTGGWIFMILSIGSVTTLVIWCFKNVLFPIQDEPDLPGGLGP